MNRPTLQCDTIPASWIRAVVVAVVAVVYYVLMIVLTDGEYDYMSLENLVIDVLFTIAVPFCIFHYGKSYRLTEEKITVCFCGIELEDILWSEVIQTGMAREGGSGRFSSDSKVIILTLNGCPKFNPETDIGGDYCTRHPFNTIRIPDEKKEHYRVIEKYYGPLDYWT